MLTLTGANTFSGGTVIAGGGILSFASDANLGAATGGITVNQGTLRSTATTSTARAITINYFALFDTAADLTINGAIGGSGSLYKIGGGTLTLTGNNAYSGGTTVLEGTLVGKTASLTGHIANETVVVFDQTTAGTYAGVMSGSGALIKAGSGTVTFTGANTYSGGTTVSEGTLKGTSTSLQGDIVNNASVVFEQFSSGTYSGAMSGTGGLTTTFGGTLTLTGANTYAGGTTVANGGKLSISADGYLGDAAGGLTLNTGRLINTAAFSTARTVTLGAGGGVFDTVADLTVTGVVTGGGALTKTNSGTLTLTGNNTYTGGTRLFAGAVAVSSDANLGDAAGGLLLNGGTLRNTAAFSTARAVVIGAIPGRFETAADLTVSGVVSGGALIKQGSGTLTLTGTNTYSGGTHVTQGTLVGNTASIKGDIFALNSSTVVFDQGFVGTHNGTISGSGKLIVQGGGGELILTGNNTYSGGTTVDHATLRISSDSNLGDAGGGLTLDGAHLINTANMATSRAINIIGGASLYTHANLTITGDISGIGGLVKYGGGTLTLTGDNNYAVTSVNEGTVIGNTTSLKGPILNNAAVVFDQELDSTYGSFISGTGTLTKTGWGGTLTLTGANFYSGGTSVDEGTLSIASDANLGAATGGLTVRYGASLRNTAAITTARTVTLDAFDAVFDTAANLTVTGAVNGTGTLVKQGAGTLTLTGNNTYSGGTRISTGTLSVSSDTNLGAGGLSILGGALKNTAAFSTARAITVLVNGTFDTAADLTVTSSIAGAGRVTKIGAGTLTLTGNNTYGGRTTVNGGILSVSSDTNLGNAAGGLAMNGGTLRNTENMTTSRSVVLGASGGTFDTVADLTVATGISGAGDLTKTGSGSLILSGINTYAGNTFVNQGRLALVGTASLADIDKVNVAAGAEFDLSGLDVLPPIGSDFINNGTVVGGLTPEDVLVLNGDIGGAGTFIGNVLFNGTYGPGNSPALVTHGNTSFGAMSTLIMELGGLARGAEYDAINALTLNLNGTLKVNLIDLLGGSNFFAPALGNFFDLMIADTISGMFTSFDFTGAMLASGLAWSWNVFDNDGMDTFRLMVVTASDPTGAPAPTALLLFGPGVALMFVLRRRRRRT